MISMGLRRMAGELGLEPRMTVPKTGVLPLHHSPAGPVFRQRVSAGERSNTPSYRRMQHPLGRQFQAMRGLFHWWRNRRLRAFGGVAISRLLDTEAARGRADPVSECGSVW